MAYHVERFHAALIVLAGHGHVKQRLIKAFENHLADVHEDDLPVAVKQSFADLRFAMHRVSPLNGEGPICASVRKMSLREASDCAAQVVDIFGELARQLEGVQPGLPLDGQDEPRVPPFLVKTV